MTSCTTKTTSNSEGILICSLQLVVLHLSYRKRTQESSSTGKLSRFRSAPPSDDIVSHLTLILMLHPSGNGTSFALYETLLAYVSPSPPRVQDIDILPSSLVSPIQYCDADAALGIPKHVLIQCFLVARGRFFPPTDIKLLDQGSHDGNAVASVVKSPETWEGEEERWKATFIILLFDPNHTTAVNFRKRYLTSNLRRHPEARALHGVSKSTPDLVDGELCLLESLVTSSMRKHNKSPTLFSHRLWLLRTFAPYDDAEALRKLWRRELGIVMKAGGKHVGDYYAWNYARDVLVMTMDRFDTTGDCRWVLDLLDESVERVKHWCFKHPRDVSGWSFLAWLIGKGVELGGDHWVEVSLACLKDVKTWQTRLSWTGEAYESFSRSAGAIHELVIHD